jgi:hypothetical protein
MGLVHSLRQFLTSLGFVEASSDTSLFIFHRGSEMVYLLLYIDDIILVASSATLLHRTISTLQTEFSMKDFGALHHFLGISVHGQPGSIFLNQGTYMRDIIEHAGMTSCKLCNTLVDTHANISTCSDAPAVSDATHYKSLVVALQYLLHSPGHCLCCLVGLPIYA